MSKNSWFGATRPLMQRVDKQTWLEFENVCEDIGVNSSVMLEEVVKEFCKEMRVSKKYNRKTIYGDLFPTSGSDS